MLRVIKYLVVFIAFLLLLLFGASIVITKFYSDQLKELALIKLNEHLETPIYVNEISVSAFSQFPMISLKLEEFYLEDIKSDNDTLVFAEELSLNFNALDMLKRNYNVRKVSLNDGFCRLKINEFGINNYSIFESKNNSDSSQFQFQLEEVSLDEIQFDYSNKLLKQHYSFDISNALLSGEFTSTNYDIETNIDFKVNRFQIEDVNFIAQKNANLDLILEVNNNPFNLKIKKGKLNIEAMHFDVLGEFNSAENDDLSLNIKGDNIKLEEIFSVFPLDYLYVLNRYKSKGVLVFEGQLDGKLSEKSSLAFTSDFSVQNGALLDRQSKVELSDINLNGSFSNVSKRLVVQSFSTKLKEHYIKGDFSINGFHNPLISSNLTGNISLDKIAFFINSPATKLVGNSTFDVQLKAQKMDENYRIKDLNGDVSILDGKASYTTKQIDIDFDELHFTLSNTDMKIRGNRFKYQTDLFDFNTNIPNWIDVFLEKSQTITVGGKMNFDMFTTSIWSDFFNKFDASEDTTSFVEVQIDKLKLDVNTLHFNQALFHNVEIQHLELKEQIDLHYVKAKGQGGDYYFENIKINNLDDGYSILTKGELNRISVDKLLYEFDDFEQTYINSNQIKGEISSAFKASFFINPSKSFDLKSLTFNSDNSFQHVKLIDYNYIAEIVDYFDESMITRNIVDIPYYKQKSKKIIFKPFRNNMSFKDGKLNISPTYLENNMLNLNLKGTQTISDSVDYYMSFNWKEIKKRNKKEKEDYLEEKEEIKELFLRITGHIDDLNYRFDREKMKMQRAEKVEQEIEIVKKIIKGEEVKEVKKDPEFEIEWEEKDSITATDQPKLNETTKKKRKKKDSTRLNKFLKKIGVEEERKEKPKFEIDQ